jgi:hypothetical protein
MTPLSPMTWNWKWKLAATGVTAVAGWLASPPLEPSAGVRPTTPAPQATSSAVAVLDQQVRRLDEQLAATPAATSSRNLFKFGQRPVTRRAAPVQTAAPPPPPAVAVPEPFPLRLTGIAIDTADGVEKRIAILSGPGGVELAAGGETASPGYRVVEVGDSFADVERTSDGARERLTLK